MLDKYMTKTIFETNYEKLLKIIPNIDKMKAGQYLKIENNPFMDLNINILMESPEELIFSMAHNFIQNGDVMADPDMEIRVYKKYKAIEALSFQNDGVGVYQQVYKNINGKKMVNAQLKKELNSFLRSWLTNLSAQGFKAK